MLRGSYALALGLAVCTAAFAETGTFSYFSPGTEIDATPESAVAREQHWIVSEIAGSMLNIAAFAGHFEAGDPFQVRNAGTLASGAQRFKLTRRVEEYTVTTAHPWSPDVYVRVARSLMADGAGMSVTEDPVQVRADAGPAAVSRLLHEHPRSAALHERAAFLLGTSVQKREAAAPGFDPRPTMCRMTAHLAIAQALHPGGATKDGRLAEQMLAAMASAQPAGSEPPSTTDRPQFWIIEP
jgi:hypothetical protein